MNTMLFRGFPLVKRNDRLVYMQERYPTRLCCLSYLDFEDWRAQAKSFQGMAFVAGKPITIFDISVIPSEIVDVALSDKITDPDNPGVVLVTDGWRLHVQRSWLDAVADE